jgi:HK97 family phage portal protein
MLDLSSRYDDSTRLYEYSSLYSIAYLACEQTKARSMGSLPVAVYRKDGGKREKVEHPLGDLLSGQANDLMTGRDLRHWASLRRDTFGNAYIWVEWRRGKPVALWPITSQVQIDFDKNAPAGRRVRYLVPNGDNYVPAGRYFSDEVINVRTSVTKDGVHGQSIARLAAHDVGLSVDLEKFYSSMLNNGNHQLGHVEVPEGRMKPEDVESLKRAVEAKRGIDEAGKSPIFGYGAKWVTDQQTMRDASLIEQQAWVLQQVCRACNVPPWMVYDSSSGNGKYENAESSRVDYVTNTLMPDTTALETALNVILRSMGDSKLYVKFDLNGLMRGDKASQGQFYREMVYMGAMTRAEVREKEDLNPIPGLEKPLIPVNYGILEPNGEVTILTTHGEPSDGMQTGTTD